ncbi:hypothetical protein SNK04_010623 [Fusarium graminearum]
MLFGPAKALSCLDRPFNRTESLVQSVQAIVQLSSLLAYRCSHLYQRQHKKYLITKQPIIPNKQILKMSLLYKSSHHRCYHTKSQQTHFRISLPQISLPPQQ